MSEWIDHDGKGMPVDGDTIVSIRIRSGEETPAKWNTRAKDWAWRWADERSAASFKSGDILAYRVHTPVTSQPTRSQAMDDLTSASAEEMFPAGIIPGAEGSRQ